MPATKAEKRKLKSLEKRAVKIGKESVKLARDTRKELEKQMRKS